MEEKEIKEERNENVGNMLSVTPGTERKNSPQTWKGGLVYNIPKLDYGTVNLGHRHCSLINSKI